MNQNYLLYSYSVAEPFIFTHPEVSVVTSPVSHSLCDGVTTIVSFLGTPINENSSPVAYSGINRQISVYSTDESLLGAQEYSIESVLDVNPSITWQSSAYIVFQEKCAPSINPTLTPVSQRDPSFYHYGTRDSQSVFTLDPFIADPVFCSVTLSCILIDGPVIDFDLCDYEDSYTSSHFDTTTGRFVFRSSDMV